MKNQLTLAIAVCVSLIFSSCSSDESNGDTGDDGGQTIPEQATITSYSKDYGYSGETVTINGTNFTADINDVTVMFDDVVAEVVSVTNSTVNITLPITENSIPVLKVQIENRIITNTVQNNYNKNIGILASALNVWHTMDNTSLFGFVYRSQVTGRDKFYYSTNDNGGSSVYRTNDGGLSWVNWGSSGFVGSFYATSNDEGWTQTSFGVNKVPVGGSQSINSDVHPTTQTIGLYVNDALTNGLLISRGKVVYETTDGLTFNEVYRNVPDGNSSDVDVFAQLDENHMWAGGFIEVDQDPGTGVNNVDAPLVLFIDNGEWTERSIPIADTPATIKQISFINEDKGYFSTRKKGATEVNRLYKSIDGGNSWELLYDANNQTIKSFTFKNESIGWYCADNEIYKTTDGGLTWVLDYTHDSSISNVTYGDGIVWGLTSDKILKFITE